MALYISFLSNECSTKSPIARNIWPDYLCPLIFKASKYRIIIKGTALTTIFVPIPGVFNLNYLVQCISNNGIGKTGRNIPHRCPFLLCLLYLEFIKTVQRDPRSTGSWVRVPLKQILLCLNPRFRKCVQNDRSLLKCLI